MNKIPLNIDHLIYTTSSLEKGMKEIESLLGVKPTIGGKHPNFGTHNAQISIGESIYLEIIAPDPSLPIPDKGVLFADDFKEKSKLTTWVLRSEEIEELHEKALTNNLKLGPIESGGREQPDGSFVNWKASNPYALPMGGAIPFLISWGNTPHPETKLPKEATLVEMIIHHPNPIEFKDKLQVLGVHIKTQQADFVKIEAKIKTANGMVTLS